MELQDRVAIITGASSGIGAVIARFYLNEGAFVFGCGLEEKSGIVHERFAYRKADICRTEDAERVVADCVARFGKADILVNCAGVTGLGTIDDTSVEEFRRQFEINVFGLYTMTKAAIGAIRASEHAVIINIVSELGVKAIPNRIAYCPSKAAVEMLTRCLAADCGPRVRVNGILPGLTETPMTRMRYETPPTRRQSGRKPGTVMSSNACACRRMWPTAQFSWLRTGVPSLREICWPCAEEDSSSPARKEEPDGCKSFCLRP